MAFTYPFLLSHPVEDKSWMRDCALVLGASIVIGLFAHVSIPLPFTPVPLATQPQVILFLSALLGGKRAVLATLLFLFEGAMGFPVFAGGAAGLARFAGPTGGYLLGYLLSAYITGTLFEQMKERTSVKAFLAMALGNIVIFACGVTWLSQLIGWKSALVLGFLPFIIGDILKLCVAVKALKTVR